MSAAESAVACCLGVNTDIVLMGEKRIELSVDRVFEVRVVNSVVLGGEVVVNLLGSSEVSVRSSSRVSSETTLEPASLFGLAASRMPVRTLERRAVLRVKDGGL